MTKPSVPIQLPTRVKYLPPVKLASIRGTGLYARSSEIAWSGMFHWLESRGHMLRTGRGYGLMHDDPQTTLMDRMRYDACVRVPETWQACDEWFVKIITFKGGGYAVQRHVGPYSEVGRIVSTVRSHQLPLDGVFLDPNRPVLCIYHSNPRTVAPKLQTADVCLPIAPERRLERE